MNYKNKHIAPKWQVNIAFAINHKLFNLKVGLDEVDRPSMDHLFPTYAL